MGVIPQVNKYEQVFIDDHHMSEVGHPGWGEGLRVSRSHVGEGGKGIQVTCPGEGVHYHMTYPMSLIPYPPPVDGHMPVKTLLSLSSFAGANNIPIEPV